MAIGFVTGLRNARADLIDDYVNAGSGPGKLRLYDGSRPSNGASITTQNMRAELVFSDPAFAAAAAAVLVANAITAEDSALSGSDITWFRVVDSDNNFVMDGNCGLSGSDLNLTSVAVAETEGVECSQFDITEGNAGI